MIDEIISDAWITLCEELAYERKQKGASQTMQAWCLSRTRLDLYTGFAKFVKMCRARGLRLPLSPENTQPILNMKQADWMDTWAICIEQDAFTAKPIKDLLIQIGLFRSSKIPEKFAKRNRVRKAAKTFAEMQDGEKLVDEIGPEGLGDNWPSAVRVVIDADQKQYEEREKRREQVRADAAKEN